MAIKKSKLASGGEVGETQVSKSRKLPKFIKKHKILTLVILVVLLVAIGTIVFLLTDGGSQKQTSKSSDEIVYEAAPMIIEGGPVEVSAEQQEKDFAEVNKKVQDGTANDEQIMNGASLVLALQKKNYKDLYKDKLGQVCDRATQDVYKAQCKDILKNVEAL